MSILRKKYSHPRYQRIQPKEANSVVRMRIVTVFVLLFVALIIVRLFILQVSNSHFYKALAFGTRELTEKLDSVRGEVFLQNIRDPENPAPLILNEDKFLLFADGRLINNPMETADALASILSIEDEEKQELLEKLSGIGNDPYEPLFKQLDEFDADRIREANIEGLGFVRKPNRFYPEANVASHISGFYGMGEGENRVGQYGVEGYFDGLLKGEGGYLAGEKDPFGAWITLADREMTRAIDGANLILTVDRSIQTQACKILAQDAKEFEARAATLIIMNPKTGGILALCNIPTFNPNEYQETQDVRVFNNNATFTPYEPGSVFKPITIAASMDDGKIEPNTIFEDKGFEVIDDFTIRNAAEKVYGWSDMKDVLVESINTGAIFAGRQLGRKGFARYVEKLGFGALTGIEIDTEVTGNIENVYKKGDIYLATASFGQGITTTPIQLIAAFSTLANHGKLIKPTIIHEIIHKDGRVEKNEPVEIRQVLSTRTASLVSAMLTSVIDDGHAKKAGVDGYLIAGKTGTAQIADEQGGYGEEFNHTFVGYGPADDAQFVMLIKYENPNERFASYTAVPTFGKIAKFLVEYLELPPDR